MGMMYPHRTSGDLYDGELERCLRQSLWLMSPVSPQCSCCLVHSFISTPLGWSIFDKLYLVNGTLFVVTDDTSNIPDRRLMISTGYDISNGDLEAAKRVPTEKEMQIITRKEAKRLFGGDAELIDGVSVSSQGDVQI